MISGFKCRERESKGKNSKLHSIHASSPRDIFVLLPLGWYSLVPRYQYKYDMAEFQGPASSSEQPTKSLASLSYVPEIVFLISVWQNPTDPSWTKVEDHLFCEDSIFSSRSNRSVYRFSSILITLLGSCLSYCIKVFCFFFLSFPSLLGLEPLGAKFRFVLFGLLGTSCSYSHRINT